MEQENKTRPRLLDTLDNQESTVAVPKTNRPEPPLSAQAILKTAESLKAKPTGGRAAAETAAAKVREQRAEEEQIQKEKTEAEQVQELEQIGPPKGTPSPLDQDAEEIKQLALQAGAKPTGAGVGSSETKIRSSLGIPRYVNASKADRLDRMAELMGQGLTAEQKEFYSNQLNNIRTQREELFSRIEASKKLQLEEKDRNDLIMGLAQGLEMIGHGFTRLFAANYGMKKGVDMSGLRFDKFDWESAQKRYDSRFNRIMDALDEKQKSIVESSAKTEQELILQQAKQEERMQDTAMKLSERADRLRIEDQRQAIDVAKAEQQTELQRTRLALMAENQKAAQAAKAAGNFAEADLKQRMVAAEALTSVKNDLFEFTQKEGDEELDRSEFAAAIEKSKAKLAKAGVDLDQLVPAEAWEEAFWGQDSISVNEAKGRIDKVLQSVLTGGQATGQVPESGLDIEVGASPDELEDFSLR